MEVGQSYSNLVTIFASDTDGDAITYSLASGAPTGLAVSASGVVSWTSVTDVSGDTSVVTKVQVSDGKVSVNFDMYFKLCKCQVGTVFKNWQLTSYTLFPPKRMQYFTCHVTVEFTQSPDMSTVPISVEQSQFQPILYPIFSSEWWHM